MQPNPCVVRDVTTPLVQGESTTHGRGAGVWRGTWRSSAAFVLPCPRLSRRVQRATLGQQRELRRDSNCLQRLCICLRKPVLHTLLLLSPSPAFHVERERAGQLCRAFEGSCTLLNCVSLRAMECGSSSGLLDYVRHR